MAEKDRPQVITTLNTQLPDPVEEGIRNVAAGIPTDCCTTMVQILAGAGLLDKVDLTMARCLVLPKTEKFALVIPMPEIPLFQQKPPFGGKTAYSWALVHGTGIQAAKAILLEGLVRPADWSYREDLSKCELPTFGSFYAASIQAHRLEGLIPAFPNISWWNYVTELRRREKVDFPFSSASYIGAHTSTFVSMLEEMVWHS